VILCMEVSPWMDLYKMKFMDNDAANVEDVVINSDDST